ncbi:Ankyrin repeat domain-containing protein 27 [Yarrowia sp. C11]|nr:Ankyrin repeat domain-containing protein 27 [Yarrowia sp. E02]KAG5371438.1 Ankyrin repeat domain-containing protein 27 [Yarrowia sp. C11]
MSEFSESLLSRTTKRGMVRMDDNDDDSGSSALLSAHTTGTEGTEEDKGETRDDKSVDKVPPTTTSEEPQNNNDNEEDPSTQGLDATQLPLPLLRHTQEFLTSLLERKYATPLKPDDISDLFHKFYSRFHEKATQYCAQAALERSKEQQMETFQEMAARKKQRELREVQVGVYDQLAEDLVCDSVYDKLFIMSSTISSDKAHNSFLRDRIRALCEVGVGMDNLELKISGVTPDNEVEERKKDMAKDQIKEEEPEDHDEDDTNKEIDTTDSKAEMNGSKADTKDTEASKDTEDSKEEEKDTKDTEEKTETPDTQKDETEKSEKPQKPMTNGKSEKSSEKNKRPNISESEFKQMLRPAGDILLEMNNSHTPREKLEKLVQAQQNIVETLTSIVAASTNADSMLPALIYTLINERTPNLWANLMFIKRFRRNSGLQGESLYCLTNFEAAITFLESVLPHEIGIDLDNVAPNIDISALVQPWQVPRRHSTASGGNTPTRPTSNVRRGSAMNTVEYAQSAISNVADNGIRVTLGGTLETSYKFLMGKFSSQPQQQTLEEVRKATGLEVEQQSQHSSHSSASSTHSAELNVGDSGASGRTRGNSTSNSILRNLGNRKRSSTAGSQNSQQSVASNTSGRVSASGNVPRSISMDHLASEEDAEQPTTLSGRLGGVIRNFRSSTPNHSTRSPNSGSPIREARGTSISSTSESEFMPKMMPHIAPPLDNVVGAASSSELTLGDVDALFHDYKRLVQHLNEIGAFRDKDNH